VHLGFAGMDVAYFIGSFVIQNQGDQMSLWKDHPNNSPTRVCQN
jgi:hypothetical protein